MVGFYDRSTYAIAASAGSAGITRGDPSANEFTSIYLDFSSVSTVDDVVDRTKALFPGHDATLHTALLRFMGITSDANIWQTFFYLVVILIAVIALACISLISGAFNISVAERVSGFALLSSIGATPGQLRRSVFLEGLIIAVIGIPLGVLIGIAGCAITFNFLGEAIANVANGGIANFELKLDAGALGIAALLTLITVLVAAWIPARRASKTNIIEALRQKALRAFLTKVSAMPRRASSPPFFGESAGWEAASSVLEERSHTSTVSADLQKDARQLFPWRLRSCS